jgi:hypothetical protein
MTRATFDRERYLFFVTLVGRGSRLTGEAVWLAEELYGAGKEAHKREKQGAKPDTNRT